MREKLEKLANARLKLGEYRVGIKTCERILGDDTHAMKNHFAEIYPEYLAGYEKYTKIIEELENEIQHR